ncbi:FimV family protein [Duganella sp. BuS-21]|uniref:type IV pilus assembly protein FimV n=1 Tax=Duganella sp. BuS-21 TaxID=2943848 RepID=UPI0035A611C9
MMQYKQLTTSLCTLALAFGSLGASAAELGDIAPRSYIGQPLAVDIDLVSLTPEELGGLQVRLAQADVYRGANVRMNPALASVQMAVERRGGKPVLHVSTSRAVEADFVHLYVELGVPGKQEVRLATVWLQRDPNPPPPPAPVVVAVAVAPPVPLASAMTPAQAEQIAAQSRAARAAAATAGAMPGAAAAAAATAAPVRDRTKPAPLPSMHEAQVGVPGEVKAAAQARRIAGVLVSADGKPIKPSAREESAEVPVGVAQALLPLAPLPLPKGVKRLAPASCAPTGMSAKECVALDQHHAELSGKLVELEARLKAVQGAIGGAAAKTGAAKAAAPAAASAAPATAPAATATATRAAASTSGHASAAASAPAAGSDHASASAPGHALTAASAPVATSGHASAPAAASAAGSADASAASASASAKGAGGKGASSAQASASLSAQGETESHAAQASSGEAAASGAASAASAASVPTKQVRVLPKLKYKKEKEKQPEQAANYTIPLIAGGVGLVALLGAGLIFWQKKRTGRGPLKIWQGFRKKKADTPKTEPVAEAAPEAAASNA